MWRRPIGTRVRTLIADHCANGIFVDIGTTTTDLIPLRAGLPATRGYTDAERLAARELIYAGVVRTPVMAFSRLAPFAGHVQGIAAERFATMADVYRLTATCPMTPTPTQRPISEARAKRKAPRGLRACSGAMPPRHRSRLGWNSPRSLPTCSFSELVEAARALTHREALAPDAPVIGAGCGRFLARRLASELHRPYRDFAEMTPCAAGTREMAARCAPAVAVALLAAKADV